MSQNTPERTPAPVSDFIQRVRSHDPAVRGSAWPEAARYGAPAVAPLADALTDEEDFEVPRAAKRALRLIVRHVGRPDPGAARERRAVENALLRLLRHRAVIVRREAVWLLSEIGSPRTIRAVAALLKDPAVREDARCALLRLPDPEGKPVRVRQLRRAFDEAPEAFKYALADTLRLLGETVPGYPSQKLVPTHHTEVTLEN